MTEPRLPCESKKEVCEATSGVLGFALDQADQAGLKISNVLENKAQKMGPQVYVLSQIYGLCKVETENLQQLGTLGFLCSLSAKNAKDIKKVDKVLTLTKKEDSYSLVDITKNTTIKGSRQ